MAAFTVTAATRADLAATFQAITTETQRIMEASATTSATPRSPLYTGTVGPAPRPTCRW
jgi:hypothetical protein